ncbi:MAG: adenylate/guanylate cyclase domain-containing protein [Deltaproteobacteria bacterium]|nr:adenylate/guanylate cyclase domain-containing protein [Deltaproteobacteria bacterium]
MTAPAATETLPILPGEVDAGASPKACLLTGRLTGRRYQQLVKSAPQDIRESIDTVERNRAVQLQYLRILAYAVPSIPFALIYHELMQLFIIVPLCMISLNALCIPLVRSVPWFRGLNAALFVMDIIITEAFVWQLGLVTTHSIFFLPLIIMAMVVFLPTRTAGALTFAMTATHLTLIVLQGMGLLPLGPMLRQSGLDAGIIREIVTQKDVLLSSFIFSSALLPGTFFGTYWLFKLLRQREYELARSNALIRRYVPHQLADQLEAGELPDTSAHERKKLVIFFSDIQGFTQAADQLEAEEFSRILNEYLQEMTAIASVHGGTIDKFIGDAILIFFGAPKATSDQDHALRCVRMAVDMQKRVGELNDKWFNEGIQVPFRVRMGINAGVATVGSFGSTGRMDYTAIGNQVNLASRLQTHCEPGKILLSHAAWALVKDHLPCIEKGEIQVKGIHYPVRTYEVAG